MAPPLIGDLYKTSNELFVKDYSSFAPKLEVSANILNGVVGFGIGVGVASLIWNHAAGQVHLHPSR